MRLKGPYPDCNRYIFGQNAIGAANCKGVSRGGFRRQAEASPRFYDPDALVDIRRLRVFCRPAQKDRLSWFDRRRFSGETDDSSGKF